MFYAFMYPMPTLYSIFASKAFSPVVSIALIKVGEVAVVPCDDTSTLPLSLVKSRVS